MTDDAFREREAWIEVPQLRAQIKRLKRDNELQCYRISSLTTQVNVLHDLKQLDYLKITDLIADRDALLAALDHVIVECECLHHEKKHNHESNEPCPVETLINVALAGR